MKILIATQIMAIGSRILTDLVCLHDVEYFHVQLSFPKTIIDHRVKTWDKLLVVVALGPLLVSSAVD